MYEIKVIEFYGTGTWNEVIDILTKYHRLSEIHTWNNMRVLNSDDTVRHLDKSTRIFKNLTQNTAIGNISSSGQEDSFEIYSCEIIRVVPENYGRNDVQDKMIPNGMLENKILEEDSFRQDSWL